jgi:hypothetical protein
MIIVQNIREELKGLCVKCATKLKIVALLGDNRKQI